MSTLVNWGALNASEAGSEIIWAAATNSVRAGIRIIHKSDKVQCTVYLDFVNAPKGHMLVRPPREQLFSASLKSASGQLVNKSPRGHAFGQDIKDVKMRGGLSLKTLTPLDNPQQVADFKLDKFFLIREAGEYELQVEVRLWLYDGRSKYLKKVLLPPVKQQVQLSKLR